MRIELPPRRTKGNPTLQTVHAVERILREAYANREPALSCTEIANRMASRRVRLDSVKASVLELARNRHVTIGSDGVMWVVPDATLVVRHVPLERAKA